MMKIAATIGKTEGKHTFLQLEDGQTLKVLTSELAQTKGVEGQRFMITIQHEEEAILSQQELARTILNTLLTNNEQKEASTTSRSEVA